MKFFWLLSLVIFFIGCASDKYLSHSERDKKFEVSLNETDSIIELIENIHPNPYLSIDTSSIDSLKTIIVKENEGKSLSTEDWIIELRRVFDLFSISDPHFCIFPKLQFKKIPKGKIEKQRIIIPFDLIRVDSTLIIENAYCRKIKRGDRILLLNDIPAANLFRYIPPQFSHFPAYMIQWQNHNLLSHKHRIKIERNGKILDLGINGIALQKIGLGTRFVESSYLNNEDVAYFKISEFENNPYIIKKFGRHLEGARKKGISNVLIDLRGNPGGSGNGLDRFLSIMTDRDSLANIISSTLKVSEHTIEDYPFLRDSLGVAVRLPDSLVSKTIELDSALYKGAFNYYVLINESTGSTAASLANIMQYNNIASLVGSPSVPNALRFGDVVVLEALEGKLKMVVSTMEYIEHTRASDGVLHPDLVVPFNSDSGIEHVLKCITNCKKIK